MFSHLYNQLLSQTKVLLKNSDISPKEFFLIVGVVLAVTIGTRFYQLGEPKGYYFDEVYHAMTVKLVARNDPRAFEYIHGDSIEKGTYVEWLHPPVAKYLQALGVLAFGESGFGWRFTTAVFGALTIPLIGLVSWKLFHNMGVTLAALYLATLETLLIAQSRIAMNDIFVVFFVLLTFYTYLRYREQPTYANLLSVGIAGGISLATKWSGLFILIWLFGVELYTLLYVHFFSKKTKITTSNSTVFITSLVPKIFALVLLPLLVYVVSYGQMFLQGKSFDYFIDLHQQIIGYQTRLDATHPYQSTPLQWFLDAKPVWYFVDYAGSVRRDIYAIGNPVIFWAGGMSAIGISLYLLLHSAQTGLSRPTAPQSQPSRKHKSTKTTTWTDVPYLWLVTTAYWAVWLPWALSPRIMFFYHYLPAVPFLVIILAYVLVGAWGAVSGWPTNIVEKWVLFRQIAVISIFSAVTVAFIWLLPQIIALQVPTWWKDSLFLGGLWK